MDMLQVLGVCLPELTPRVANVSQSLSFASLDQGRVGTFTPHGEFLLTHRVRLMLGREGLRVQGLFLPDKVLDQFPDSLLHDLAGNAFSGSTCMAPLGALMVMMARLFHVCPEALLFLFS